MVNPLKSLKTANKALQLIHKSGAPYVALLLLSTELNRQPSKSKEGKVLREKIFSIIILAITVNCASIQAQPIANCKSAIAELENYMLIDIKSILPSESMFWANSVNASKITNGREILNKIERCSSVSDSNDRYRRLQSTLDRMLFYLNLIT